ncbi:Phage Tail Protein X [compost metagenome]
MATSTAKEESGWVMSTYRTIQGDTWDGIAYKVTGSEMMMTRLMQANPEHTETVIFSADIVLNIPEIDAAASGTLPPWRQEEADE